ncbi:MAG: hypothetical protein ACI9FN_001957 [Saprospiraceae bacterium]|jgi:hypothetical protein
MKKNIFSIIILVSALISLSFTQSDPFKAIVLINGEAFLVDLTEKGAITATYQKVNNYFRSSESHGTILARLSKGTLSESGKSIVFYEEEIEPVVPFTTENEAVVAPGSAQYVGFSPRRALLQKDAVDQIRKISSQFRQGVIQNITITSHQRDTYESRSLARNRAKAIHDLLGAFGVSTSIIDSSTPFAQPGSKTDFVRISF